MSVKLLAASLLAGCTVSGSVDLSLELPSDPDLDPQGMTTVTVIATGSDGVPIANTSVINADDTFNAGDLPVGTGVQIDVLLRDVSSRLVGVGEANQLIDIRGDAAASLSIPVRRPFVYSATDTQLISFDPTLDARDTKFQGQLMGVTAPMLAISAGGDRLAVISKRSVQSVDTGTNVIVGAAVTLPADATDAASVPGTHQIVVGHGMGISVVDLDTGNIQTAAASNIDRVTVGLSAAGTPIAYGLSGRVDPPEGPLDGCGGSSSLVSVDVTNPTTVEPMPITGALSDIAADPAGTALFGTDPCAGKVVDLASGNKIADLERAAVLTVLGGRVWAAGSHASTPTCFTDQGNPASCDASSDTSCPPPNGPVGTFVAFVTSGSSLIVSSIPTTGSEPPITFDVPDRRETIVNTDDDARQHAQVLRAFGTTPLDLVALPGGQYVALVTKSHYFIQQLISGGTTIILPCLSADTADWLLIDMASVSIASRVRTKCDLVVGPADPPFQKWACDDPPDNETSKFGSYTPASVGALFGR